MNEITFSDLSFDRIAYRIPDGRIYVPMADDITYGPVNTIGIGAMAEGYTRLPISACIPVLVAHCHGWEGSNSSYVDRYGNLFENDWQQGDDATGKESCYLILDYLGTAPELDARRVEGTPEHEYHTAPLEPLTPTT